MTEDVMGAPAAHAVFGESEEFGRVMLPMYVGSMQVIGNRVMEAARREGFAGTLDQRLRAMGWWIEPLYTAAQARVLASAEVAREREACARDRYFSLCVRRHAAMQQGDDTAAESLASELDAIWRERGNEFEAEMRDAYRHIASCVAEWPDGTIRARGQGGGNERS